MTQDTRLSFYRESVDESFESRSLLSLKASYSLNFLPFVRQSFHTKWSVMVDNAKEVLSYAVKEMESASPERLRELIQITANQLSITR